MMKQIIMSMLAVGALWVSLSVADTGLTIYNQDFAVVRDTMPLKLNKGVNRLSFSDITGTLEPDSVILRDPAGKHHIQILEQNYRADPVTQQLLLHHYEGKVIDFLIVNEDREEHIVKGEIIRSGYVPLHSQRYQQQQGRGYNVYGQGGQPVIKVDGQLRFQLPGLPLFPALSDDSILKPTLDWVIETNRSGTFDAELCYLTSGLSWEADYNVIASEKGDVVDIIGWITMENQSGKSFKDAMVKLLAGDVSKLQPEHVGKANFAYDMARSESAMAPPVTEKSFDEYHLYTLARKTTLHDQETKQVEFVRAESVTAERIYVYDGAHIGDQYRYFDAQRVRNDRNYGTQTNKKVWIMRQFENREANNLGIPLPKGVLRFYRRDDDGQLQFVGENSIDHTPKDETVRVYTGNAFDLVGERKQTNYQVDSHRNWLDESFEITLRNHKENDAVEIRVVEHLYRWINWKIVEHSHEYKKTDARTIEIRVKLEPDEEKKITYKVHYTW